MVTKNPGLIELTHTTISFRDFGTYPSTWTIWFEELPLTGVISAKLVERTPGMAELLEVAGASDHTLKLRDIEAQWKQISDGLEDQAVDLFGATPIRRAMEEIESRFAQEFTRFEGTPHAALVIVSDGQSSDGSPVEPCLRIARCGTTILRTGYFRTADRDPDVRGTTPTNFAAVARSMPGVAEQLSKPHL
jgi:hypothetical protein